MKSLHKNPDKDEIKILDKKSRYKKIVVTKIGILNEKSIFPKNRGTENRNFG